MIGTVLIAVIGYSAAAFFFSLAVISFAESGGKMKNDREAIRRLITILMFLVVAMAFASVTRLLTGGAA